MTTVPSMASASKARRIASTAAWSASFLLPRPISRAQEIAAISVTRTTSSARFLSIPFLLEHRCHRLGDAGRLALFDAGVDRLAGGEHQRFALPADLVEERHRGAA